MSEKKKNIALSVRNLHIFYRGLKKTSIRSSWMHFKDKVEVFEALKGVSFDLEEGKILGIIGKNGSGKSTMLRAIAGIFSPDEGTIDLHGRRVSLLSIGVGFNKKLTGRENIYLSGMLLGFTEDQIAEKENEIVGFADIGKFIDRPVKTYSSGMYSKLAFAITAILETDIMLIDEVLSVGDQRFKEKSYNKMKELISDDTRTVVIVSHSLSTIEELCDEVLWLNDGEAAGTLGQMISSPETLLFKFLDYLPLSGVTGLVSLVVISLFFITSADSGIYVLNNIASRDKSLVAPRWQAVMWGVLMSVVAIVLMQSGGLANLQAMTLLVALPFAMLMLLMCFSLWKGLSADKKYFDTKVNPTSIFWTGDKWKERLEQMMNQTQEKDILRFLKHTVLPAMRELRQELIGKYDLSVQINTLFDQDEPAVELVIQKDLMRDFMYGVKSIGREVSEQLINDDNLPHIQHSMTYEPYTYFFDGRVGYDVQYMDQDELIADMLKHYERYLSLLDDVGQELMAHEQTELAE